MEKETGLSVAVLGTMVMTVGIYSKQIIRFILSNAGHGVQVGLKILVGYRLPVHSRATETVSN